MPGDIKGDPDEQVSSAARIWSMVPSAVQVRK
jgi:hypothetical protein